MRSLFSLLIISLLAAPSAAAITTTNHGTNGLASSTTAVTITPSGNFAAGSMGVVVCSANNAGSGGATSISSVTDSVGNTWTIRANANYDPGLASEGISGIIATTTQNVGPVTTGTTITVNFSAATASKTVNLIEVIPTAGSTLAYVTGGIDPGGGEAATTTPTETTGSITSGNVVICALHNEDGTGQTTTADSDTTNGSWSTMQNAEIGTGAGGTNCTSQAKVVTGTATQTYNPTLAQVNDCHMTWIEISESVSSTAKPHIYYYQSQ